MSSAALKAAVTGHAGTQERNIFTDLLQRNFDPDAWHVMNERDNALVRDEIMHGTASRKFVYEFEIKGSRVTGVSVVGARELASQYKGIKQRIVATVEKRGSLFIFRSFAPLNIETRNLPELSDEDDFYESIMEVSDIKTGNSVEVRKKETKLERKRDGGFFERPHYDVIADSKAYRNGVLSVLPQSVVQDFLKRCLAAGDKSTEMTIDQRRAAAQTYAAKHAIALDRQKLADLSFAELDGLGAAASQGTEQFARSASALGLITSAVDAGASAAGAPAAATKGKAKGPAKPEAKPAAEPAPPPPAKTYAQYVDQIQNAVDAESAGIFLDYARGVLNEEQLAELNTVYRNKWST